MKMAVLVLKLQTKIATIYLCFELGENKYLCDYQIRGFSQMLTLIVMPIFFPALINKQQLLLKGRISM